MEFQSTSSSSSFYDAAIEMNFQKVCCCCLSNSTRMINLQCCKHADFLQNLLRMDLSRSTVCLVCHSMLEKIKRFQKQIIDSTTILKKKLPHILPTKLHILELTEITKFYESEFEEQQTIKEETVKLELEPTTSSLAFETEVKIEPSLSSEYDDDLPLCIAKDVKNDDIETKAKIDHTSSAKCKNDLPLCIAEDANNDDKKKYKQSHKYYGKYKEKILIYNLTRDELEEERDIESKKENYLKLPYKCESCIKGFDYEVTLMNHKAKKHGQIRGGIQCDVCKSFLTPGSYNEHKKNHYKRLQCVLCGLRFRSISTISHHFNQEHGDAGPILGKFRCTDCEFSCSSRSGYRYHRDKHKQKTKCTKCGKNNVNLTALRVHMLNVHGENTAKYKCSQCDKSYYSKTGFDLHRSTAHSETTRDAYCGECKNHFRTKQGLLAHLSTHSNHIGSKRFECADCHAKFVRKMSLQQHIQWIHLKTVAYQCKLCEKDFMSMNFLKKHIRYVHEKKRPPRDKICDYCGRGFSTNQTLRTHIRRHTGERPLTCPQCGATFAHPAALRTHSKLVHKEQKVCKKRSTPNH